MGDVSEVLLEECDFPGRKSKVNFVMPEDSNVHVLAEEEGNTLGAEPLAVDTGKAGAGWRLDGSTLVVENPTSAPASVVVTLPEAYTCRRGDGTEFSKTWFTTDDDDTMNDITTLVVHVGPGRRVRACSVHASRRAVTKQRIRYDGGAWITCQSEPHPEPYPERLRLLGLPLRLTDDERAKGVQWPCGQSFEGGLTHYGAANTHSVDFECEEGTEVVAAASGVVLKVCDRYERSGGHVAHLVEGYNEVIVAHPDGTEACYLHLRRGSVRVAEGQRVARGDLLAETGSVGFAPWPHIHFQLNVSSTTDDLEDIGPSVPFAFEPSTGKGRPFVPVAGYSYSEAGRVCR